MMDMEPSPPRKPKELPFYEAPDHVQTSAKIIEEARTSLARPQLRALQTRRPVTPQDGQRKLFGEQSVRDPTNRPPSAFSLGSRHFDSESRPVSGTRLSPLDHKPKTPVIDHDSPMAPKPPADPNRPVKRPSSRQRVMPHSSSSDALSSASEGLSRARSGSLQDVSEAQTSGSKPGTPELQRRVHSGPKERTKHIMEERGEGDGSEAIPRVDSRSSNRRKSSQASQNERVESGYASDAREGSAGSQRGSSAGKPGSGGKREEESPEEAQYYNTHIGPIVDRMAAHIKDKDPTSLLELSNELYQALEEGRMLGKHCKRRSGILKTVFKLLDLDSPKLLLGLARLILALRVSGNNLTNVCKLVFKVSREEKNDLSFTEGNILELLLETLQSIDHSQSSDALVYCVGALKFLSGNTTVAKQIAKLRGVPILGKLLAAINKTNIESGKASEQLGHILVQLTACLRNLADVAATRSQFISYDVVIHLCKVMEVYPTDSDLMLNISRIFSKLTLHGDCCKALSSQSAHFRSFLHLLKIHQRREDLVVRISFILGNLTAKSDLCRTRLFQQPRALDTLLAVFKLYFELDLKSQSQEPQEGSVESEKDKSKKSPNKTEDVLIKVIRIIANLSINEEIGPVIAASQSCINLLLQTLAYKEVETSEELVLNAMATINNLSFYNSKNSALLEKQMSIAEALLKFLVPANMEGLAEATRVFGNLSRDRAVRDLLVKNKVDQMMVALLDSGNREVVFTACGVLINLMADENKRPMLQREGGVKKLIEVLRDFGRTDWQLASMVCQTLWNYSGKITSCNACFGEQETQDLIDVLEEFTDDEYALDPSLNPDFDEEMRDFIHEMWKSEFLPVATQLLQRLETYLSDFEPLEHPT